MPERIVDALDDKGVIVASYPIILDHMNMPLTDNDFISEAKNCHEEDGLSPALIESWIVRK